MTYFLFQGSNIHVKVPTMFKQAFDFLLVINNTQTIAKFKVLLNELLFKPYDHKFLLVFTSRTFVCDENKHDMPPKIRKFTPFADIISRKWKMDVLIDMRKHLWFFNFFYLIQYINHSYNIFFVSSYSFTYVIGMVADIDYTQL